MTNDFNLASVGFCQIIKKIIENHNADSYTTCIMVFRCEYSSEYERKELNHTKGDFNPPQTSDEPVFQTRLGRKSDRWLVSE